MKSLLAKFKPAVDRRVLILLAGVVWIAAGALLLGKASLWLLDAPNQPVWILTGAGVLTALLIHHFGFLRIVDKNLGRILPMQDKRCAFSFMQSKNYLLVAVMIAMGVGLRHTSIPKYDLAVVYIGIGLALILSSLRYIRHFVVELMHDKSLAVRK